MTATTGRLPVHYGGDAPQQAAAALGRVRERKAPPGKYRLVLRDPTTGDARVLYDPQPKQDQLHACEAPNVLYGGQAGGGKSHGLRWHGIMACARHHNLRVLLLRRKFKDLEHTHLLNIPIEVPPELATYNDSKHFLKFPSTSSVMVFGHCQHEKDIASYLSTEWDIILVDEGSTFTPRMLRLLRTRLRTKNRTIRPQFVVGTNPGGEGHLWLYQRFISREVPPEESRGYKTSEWAFIPSALEDNEYLDADEYEKQFSDLSDEEYRGYRHGDWEAFAGQFFTSWRRAVHVVPSDTPVEDWWERVACLDWAWTGVGYFSMGAVDEFGRIWGYKEFTFSDVETPTDLAELILTRCPLEMERNAVIIGDSQMWTPQASKNGVSTAQELNEAFAKAGLGMVVVQANKDRLNGWRRFKSWLKPNRRQPEGKGGPWGDANGFGPWLRFLAYDEEKGIGCPYLIATIHAQLYDETKPGDMKKGATDHGCDGWRYLLMSREPLTDIPIAKRPPKSHEKRVSERTRKILDMVRSRHNQSMAMDDETAEAITRELGVRDDDEVEQVSDSMRDAWQ
jgi:hypothetical protein